MFTQSLLNPPLCRFRVGSVNISIYDMCFFSANNFAHAQTLYRMRSPCRSSMIIWSYSWIYEYYAGKHWMLYWMQENQTATYFLRSRLFTYDTELSKSLSCLSDNRSGRCGQCVRPIKHLPDLHIFYNFNWITPLCKFGIFVYFIHKSIVLYVYFHMSHKNVLY
jgi:hypothetical protein